MLVMVKKKGGWNFFQKLIIGRGTIIRYTRVWPLYFTHSHLELKQSPPIFYQFSDIIRCSEERNWIEKKNKELWSTLLKNNEIMILFFILNYFCTLRSF